MQCLDGRRAAAGLAAAQGQLLGLLKHTVQAAKSEGQHLWSCRQQNQECEFLLSAGCSGERSARCAHDKQALGCRASSESVALAFKLVLRGNNNMHSNHMWLKPANKAIADQIKLCAREIGYKSYVT